MTSEDAARVTAAPPARCARIGVVARRAAPIGRADTFARIESIVIDDGWDIVVDNASCLID
jgi:hypothetical protein